MNRTALDPARWGSLRTARPFSENYGLDRGTPVDRMFIDTFLGRHSHLIRGRVLEVGRDVYSTRHGGTDVTDLEILDIDPHNGSATLVADLDQPGALPMARYDCAVITQTLQYVAEPPMAVANLHSCLARGGALLVTVPGITRVDPGAGRSVDRWRFTPQGLGDLLTTTFGTHRVSCVAHGDLHTATAFLYGLAAEDIGLAAGDDRTSDFAVVVCGSAMRR